MSVAENAGFNTISSLNRALRDAMADDPRVIIFGEDVGDAEGGGVLQVTQGLSSKFGRSRVRSTPISEQAIVGAAIGAALAGLRPVVEIMLMNFTAVAMDMIVNHAAKLRFMSGGQTHVPMVIRTMTGSGFSNGGQHSDFLEAWFAHTAGLRVVIPSNPLDAYGLLRTCIEDEDPCLFIEPIGLYWNAGPIPAPDFRVALGRANVLREGNDLTIISYGRQVLEALDVAESLKGSIDAEVIDLRSISPLDKETILRSVAKTGRAVIFHEAVRRHGVGAEVSALITERLFGELKAPVQRIGAKFAPVPFAKSLETAFIPGKADLENAMRDVMQTQEP